jgi:hypothetical protein
VSGAAFGIVRDPVAWAVRGFVEQGLPELPSGGGAPGTWGGFEVDSGGRVAVRFHSLDWDEERSYAVYRLAHADGRTEVLVLCADSLFRHGFPEAPVETLGGRILAHVRHHEAAFAAWRAQGGQLSPGDRASVGDARGALPPDSTFLHFMKWAHGQGIGMQWGPHQGWWPVAARPGGPVALQGIVAGQGADRAWKLRLSESELPINREYAAVVQRVGRILQVVAVVSALLALVSLGFVGAWSWRAAMGAFSTRPLLASLAALGFAQCGLQAWLGTWMRQLRGGEKLGWIALAAGVPFSLAGVLTFWAGLWAWWVLRDERARVVLPDQ